MASPKLHWVGAAATLALLAACGSSQPSAPSAPAPSTNHAGPGDIEGSDAVKLPTAPPAPSPVPLPSPPLTAAGQRQFVTAVFNDIEATWSRSFAQAGLLYTPARLMIFTSSVVTSCGPQTSEVGPFYCSSDLSVYLDLRFFDALGQQLGVTGDFAHAYVIAHEVGHHIQNLLGVTERVARAGQQDPTLVNSLSVRVELQADCLAGVWAHSTYQRNLLESGDLAEALTAAAVVGDDFLQNLSRGQIEPDNWTHGSSAQRQRWLTTGFETGRPAACDTFSNPV